MLEPVVPSAPVQPSRDDLRGRGQDDGQVGQVDAVVDGKQVRDGDPVAGLEDQGGGEVPVADHDVSCCSLGPDLGVEVVVPVGRHQAGQRMPVDLVDQGPREHADRPGGWFGGLVHGMAVSAQEAGERCSGGGLAGPAGAVDGDERAGHAAAPWDRVHCSRAMATRLRRT
jgi:hypothetical protein